MASLTDRQQTGVVDLGALLDAGEGAVVTLVAGETRLAVHRAVLSATSPVFAAMFRHDTLEVSTGEVAIRDVEGPVLRQLVAYLYTGRTPQQRGIGPQLLAAADKYSVSVLKDACEQQLVAHLDLENVAAAAMLAMRHSCPTLQDAAVNFVRLHRFQVMATKGFAEAVRRQPEDVVEFTRLLAEAPPETSNPAAANSTGTPSPAATSPTNAAANRRHRRTRRRTAANPAAAAAPSATFAAAPALADAAAVPAAANDVDEAPTARSVAHSHDHRTPAGVPQPTAHHQTPLSDDAAIFRFRRLSAEEKSRRLTQAAKEGAVKEVRALIAAGADVGAGDGMERTALHHAADRGHVGVVRSLLEAGAAVGARERALQWTPLHYAAGSGHPAVVRQLLAASADPNAMSEDGERPLHLAAYWGQAEAAAALMEGGADSVARDMWGCTALDHARQRHHRLLEHMLQ